MFGATINSRGLKIARNKAEFLENKTVFYWRKSICKSTLALLRVLIMLCAIPTCGVAMANGHRVSVGSISTDNFAFLLDLEARHEACRGFFHTASSVHDNQASRNYHACLRQTGEPVTGPEFLPPQWTEAALFLQGRFLEENPGAGHGFERVLAYNNLSGQSVLDQCQESPSLVTTALSMVVLEFNINHSDQDVLRLSSECDDHILAFKRVIYAYCGQECIGDGSIYMLGLIAHTRFVLRGLI